MANLTRTAYITREAVKYTTLSVVVLLILRSGLGMFRAYWRSRHPLPPPAPDVAFGQLPALEFSKIKPKPKKEFVLQTISGTLPKFPSQLKVYFVVAQKSRFLALEKTNEVAKNLGFSSPPEKVSDDLYRYHNKTINITLTINPLTKTFLYTYPYLNDQTLITLPLPSQERIMTDSLKFLNKTGQRQPDLTFNSAEIKFWRIENKQLKSAPSLSEAHLAQINFFRDPIENQYPIYPQDLDQANVSLILSGDTGQRQIVEGRYTYFFVDLEKSATYPLKPITQAWEEVQGGQYHLAKVNKTIDSQTITIHEIYLAYFDPHYPTNFLQPIYVFEGDHNFFAFVPAISIEWVAE